MRNTIVYRSSARHRVGFLESIFRMAREVVRCWPLVVVLFKRDYFAAHKRSALGATWLFISPILGIVSWVYMSESGLFHPGDTGVSYPAFLLMGSSIWGLFIAIFNGTTDSLKTAGSYIVQVNFPHEVLLFKQVLQQLANFAITFAINILLLLLFKVTPSWKLIFFPLAIVPLCSLAAALGTLNSLFSVVAPDIRRGVDHLMTIVVFMTPVFYSINNANPMVRNVIYWNPLTYLIDVPRELILSGKFENGSAYLWVSAGSIFLWMITLRLFYITEQRVIEKMI